MHIVEATNEHIPVISRLADITWPVAYKEVLSLAQLDYMLDLFNSPHSLQQQMESGNRFIVLYDNIRATSTPVGFASFSKTGILNNVYKLHKLYVIPDQQGKGAGKLLVEYILQVVKQEGGSKLILNVNRKNPAQHFYHKLGFTITREEDIDIGKGFFMNDYVMTHPFK
jgi:GNAT superfamily N-acetyltransferase